MHDTTAIAVHADPDRHVLPDGLMVLVWVALLILTALTVGASVWFPGRVGITAAVIITPIKAALILMYFMHLKYEKPVFRWMFLTAAVILAVIMGLTLFDYTYR
ncbi:cytochrome-c oxidase [bacterium]|nr:MAG: cytochrome-c oxidase [bacterium]